MYETIKKILFEHFDPTLRQRIESWLVGNYDDATKEEIFYKLQTNPEEIRLAFSSELEFGTAGARALLGVGPNRFNRYTVQRMTQALSNYLTSYFERENFPLSIVVGYDNRKNSDLFAYETAKVFAGNGFKVFLFSHLCPTFLVSFAVKELACHAGIMITASHNPPEYNGYKVYWQDGGQLLSPHDKKILEKMHQIQHFTDIKVAETSHPLIHILGEELFEKYLEKLDFYNVLSKENAKEGKNLHVIYSNLHGAGITLMPKALKRWGFTHFEIVEKQEKPDPSFPFAPLPNPEEEISLQLGIKQMLASKADLFLSNDPDVDRLGVVCSHVDKPFRFSGHELACLILDHLCHTRKISKKAAAIRSLVTTPLFDEICKDHQITPILVLTGFKYVAQKIALWSETHEHDFFFGAEDSLGYLIGPFVRDKDGVSSGLIIAEMALKAKKEKKSLVDKLFQLYHKYGFYKEKVFSINLKEGKEGLEKSKKIIEHLRSNSYESLGKFSIARKEDYKSQTSFDLKTKKSSSLFYPPSRGMGFFLEDHTQIIVRPSGTEPKLKIYISIMQKQMIQDEQHTLFLLNQRINDLFEMFKKEWVI